MWFFVNVLWSSLILQNYILNWELKIVVSDCLAIKIKWLATKIIFLSRFIIKIRSVMYFRKSRYFDGSHFKSRPYWEISPYRSRLNCLFLTQEMSLNKLMLLMKGPLYALVHWVIAKKYVMFCYFWRLSWICIKNIIWQSDKILFDFLAMKM